MTDRYRDEDLPLPPELAELDAELSSIRYEERPSFGPELEAELARQWPRMRQPRSRSTSRLAAAAAVALLLAAVGVPQARASLARFVTRLQVERPSPPSETPTKPLTAPRLPLASPPGSSGNGRDPAFPEGEGPAARAGVVIPPESGKAVYPEIVDRPGTEALIRRYYPLNLQKAGVGGTVTLRLWVDSTGAVEFANLAASSGVPELDRAALRAAPRFHFDPARRLGKPVGTWVQFNVEFRRHPATDDSTSLPKVTPLPAPAEPDTASPDLTPEWESGLVLSSPERRAAGDLLKSAIGDEHVLDRLGPIEGILEGEPPPGVAPTQWRAEAGRALERAMARDPDNPAVLLALGRLRSKQGMRDEARGLFERGLQRVTREGASASSGLVTALHYERGMLYEQSWLGARNLGRVPQAALTPAACAQVRPDDAGASFASAEELVAWNYMCPAELEKVWTKGFQNGDGTAQLDFDRMMTSLRAAVTADPTNVGANVELLLGLADQGRWAEMLAGARRFAWITHGHPDGFLLSGLALERLGLTEDAQTQFDSALVRLPAAEVADLEDVRAIATRGQSSQYLSLPRSERERWLKSFWAPMDPVLSTSVNERRVEHLARTTYAHFRFGSAASDPGRVWVRYGRPDRIRAIASGPDVRTEFWDYGQGPDITFRGVAGSDINLTSEGRSYLNDLQQVFPHRYGRAARIVEPLPGQVSRFRASVAKSTDVEITTRIPPTMVENEPDSLELSIWELGPNGEKLSVDRRRISPDSAPLSVYSFASPDAARVAVELLNRATGRVATMRAAAHLSRHTDGSGWTSDLLVTKPEVPARWERDHNRLWLQPETLTGPIPGGDVGVYFELYDLPASAAWYQLRMEVEDRVTGEIRSVTFRPASKSEFRTTWDRRPSGSGTTSDLLIARLDDVPPGPYVLRVLADVPGARSPLSLERNITLASGERVEGVRPER